MVPTNFKYWLHLHYISLRTIPSVVPQRNLIPNVGNMAKFEPDTKAAGKTSDAPDRKDAAKYTEREAEKPKHEISQIAAKDKYDNPYRIEEALYSCSCAAS
jgi:hypothetical protein